MHYYIILFIIIVFILDLIFGDKKKDVIARRKGEEGERRVSNVLSKLPKDYVIVNDLLLKYKNTTTQIDHVVICKKGIFVIETKNYSGMIYGDDFSKYWIQKLNGKKNNFYSPVLQNRTHKNAIKALFNNKDIPIYSIIVFCGKCNIKYIKSSEDIIYVSKLKRYLKSYKGKISVKDREVKNIVNVLKENNINSKKIKKNI